MNHIYEEKRSQNGSKDMIKEGIKKNPAVAFFLITYVFSWGIWLPVLIKGLGLRARAQPSWSYTGADF